MSILSDFIGKNSKLKNITKRINNVPVEIKGYIDVESFKNIVQTVSSVCFKDGVYKAENREIANRFVILKYLTDIEVDEEDITEIFKATQGGMWFNEIMREVTKLPIWAEVDLAIDRQIDYLIATRQTAFDKLCTDLSAILSTDLTQNIADVKEVLNGLSKVDKKEFVKVVTENVIEKTEAGGDDGSKKSEGAID